MRFTPFVSRSIQYFDIEHPIHQLPLEVRSLILRYCDMPTLLGLCHDKNWRDSTLQEVAASFRLLLATFTPDPAAFRHMMRRTNTIISGSTALYFLLRSPCTWTPGDTDILVSPAHFDTALEFIMALPGATITHDSHNAPPETYEAIRPNFQRLVKVTTLMAKFDVMMSREASPYHSVAHYWTTLVMNALTADFFVCAYPSLTFSHRGAMKSRHVLPAPFEKYTNRGFQFFTPGGPPTKPDQSCARLIACSRRQRYFGDDNCLVFPIIDDSVSPADDDTETLESSITTAWQLGGKPCGNTACFIPTPRVALTMTVNGGWQAGLQAVQDQ
ncbi:hypothetical protein QCA50_019362 [Cerrena zonata]|uniref:F-box domain-containing protein n=1 Tax=Cerrena zonata TaxID=2478898 RepID=A0AAW0FK14_9APHY